MLKLTPIIHHGYEHISKALGIKRVVIDLVVDVQTLEEIASQVTELLIEGCDYRIDLFGSAEIIQMTNEDKMSTLVQSTDAFKRYVKSVVDLKSGTDTHATEYQGRRVVNVRDPFVLAMNQAVLAKTIFHTIRDERILSTSDLRKTINERINSTLTTEEKLKGVTPHLIEVFTDIRKNTNLTLGELFTSIKENWPEELDSNGDDIHE